VYKNVRKFALGLWATVNSLFKEKNFENAYINTNELEPLLEQELSQAAS